MNETELIQKIKELDYQLAEACRIDDNSKIAELSDELGRLNRELMLARGERIEGDTTSYFDDARGAVLKK